MSALYDYGPPVVVGDGPDDSGTPATTTGEVEDAGGGDSPQDNSDATTIVEMGGSPSDEVLAANDPNITSLSPTTAVIGANANVTVNGTNFRSNSAVEADGAAVSTVYVSDTRLTATLADPGTAKTVAVTVRNSTSGLESNTVNFTFTASE